MLLLSILNLTLAKRISPSSDGYHVTHNVSRDKFSWIALGDWGGRFAPFYTTDIQLETAASMERVARIIKPEFILALGDNFYDWGVQDIDDPMWKRTFENVYASAELHCPWYPTAGNHDYKARRDGYGGNYTAQVLYRFLHIYNSRN